MREQKKFNVWDAAKNALFSTILAFLVFGPISGLVLEGYNFNSNLYKPIFMALAVGLGRFLLSLYVQTKKDLHVAKKEYELLEIIENSRYKNYMLLAILCVAMVVPFFSSKYLLSIFILGLIYVLLGLGLNIVVGLAGLLDLGFVAFYAVGAYGYALGSQYLGLGFWTAIPFAAVTAACFGAVLGFPVLRMHGDYLAIVTLGFGEIIRLVLNNWLDFTGGPNGVSAPEPTFFGLEFSRRAKQGGTPFHEFFNVEYSSEMSYIFLYIVLLLVVAFTVFAISRLKKMPVGRAWEALREDEIACRSLGLNHVTVKLSAFSMGAMIGGVAGVFFAAFQGFVNPTSFTFFESALILAVVVLGGMGSTIGVIFAALTLTLLPEVLREFSTYRILIFGILMVVMMIWKPRGLIKVKRPRFHWKGA